MIEKIDKIGQRAVIQYLHVKGLTPKKVDKDMVTTLKDNTPLYSMVKKRQRALVKRTIKIMEAS